MRTLVLILALAAATSTLAACQGTSDPWDPAIQAMQPVNSCGTFGSQDVNQCVGHPRSNN